MNIYTIYKRPLGHPMRYVVTHFIVDASGPEPQDVKVANTLEEARMLVPPTADCRMAPDPDNDHESIVETWI